MRADLHRRGVGAQHDAGARRAASTKKVSCIVRAGWSAAKFSASKLNHSGLDLGPLGDLPAHADEEVGDALHQRGERVPGAARRAGPTAA